MRIVSKGLSFTYNKKSVFFCDALKNVDIEISEGDFFGVIGHTGSGKSTLIQHLNALIPVQSGELYVGEYDLKFKTKKEYKAEVKNGAIEKTWRSKKDFRKQMTELRSKVGMVFQYPEYQLFGETVFEDVSFGLKNFFPDMGKEEVEERVKQALNAVSLDFYEIKDKSPFDLSGGQKRRIAIAGVIVSRPEILVLDEPVAGLDPSGKRELMLLLHDLHEKWCKTIVIISHDMNDVAENCNMVAVLNKGECVAESSPKVLFSDAEKLKKIRLDVPITAFLTEQLSEIGVKIETDYKTEDFINKVVTAYKGKNRC